MRRFVLRAQRRARDDLEAVDGHHRFPDDGVQVGRVRATDLAVDGSPDGVPPGELRDSLLGQAKDAADLSLRRVVDEAEREAAALVRGVLVRDARGQIRCVEAHAQGSEADPERCERRLVPDHEGEMFPLMLGEHGLHHGRVHGTEVAVRILRTEEDELHLAA